MNYLIDQEPTRPLEQIRKDAKQHAAVLGNERMIALVGAVLLVLIRVEIVIAANCIRSCPSIFLWGSC